MKKYILAADVGGTTIECGLFDLEGKLLSAKTLQTSEIIKADVAEGIADEMMRRLQKQGITIEEVCCIGLGVPGLVDTNAGMIIKAPSLKWNHYPLREKLHSLLGVPVHIGNDVNTGLLGEVEEGSLKDVNDAVYLMIGTSIGAGLLLNGEIYEGSRFSAGEVGFMVTDYNVLNDGFTPARPGYGYLSTLAGGFGMSQKYAAETGTNNVTAKELFLLAENGDSVARKIVDQAVLHLTAALINITTILNSEVILVGGGVGTELDLFLEKIDANLEKYLQIKPDLKISTMQNRSVLYGAYALCRKRLNEE